MQANADGLTTIKRAKIKVRSGCLTCKIRKIKCDEGKPACERCLSTGRRCDGYLNAEELKRQPRMRPRGRITPPHPVEQVNIDALAFSHSLPFDQRQWLTYFNSRIGPALSDLADTNFWTCLLPQLTLVEPAICHAVIAVGSSFARNDPHLPSTIPIDAIRREFSLEHYSLAIGNLQQRLQQGSVHVDVPLICCLLFICVECLLGSRPFVLHHLRNGLKILKSERTQVPGGYMALPSASSATSTTTHVLRKIFGRLGAQSTLFGEPASLEVEALILAPPVDLSLPFHSILDAQCSLDTLISLSLNFIKASDEPEELLRSSHDGNLLYALQVQLKDRFIKWKAGLDHLEANVGEKNPDHDDLARVLQIQHAAAFIYLCNCLENQETSYDVFQDEFTTIVRTAQALFRAERDTNLSNPPSPTSFSSPRLRSALSVFTLDTYVIPALYLTAIKCRHSAIRQEAIALLESKPGREGLWDARLHGKVARRVMEIEECQSLELDLISGESIDANFPLATYSGEAIACARVLDERARVQDVDIELVNEEPCCSAAITFWMASNGASAPLVVWQELISF